MSNTQRNDNVYYVFLPLSECEDLCPLHQHGFYLLKIPSEEEVHMCSYLVSNTPFSSGRCGKGGLSGSPMVSGHPALFLETHAKSEQVFSH